MIGKYKKFEGNRLKKYGGHLGTTFGKYGKRWETHEKILVYWDDIWELFGNIIARMCC